ncbi:MAG: aminodeoxychorismate synthase component I, partial [Betaproteobacteria bacterium]|nr:aminodeoxychorismate synthase component I [Betaproteobacteria bacterium]
MRLVFDFADHPGHVIRRVFTQPSVVLKAYHPDEVRRLLDQLDEATQGGAYAAGYLSYECAPAFESTAQVHSPSLQPIAQFGIFAAPESTLPIATSSEPLHCSPWVLGTTPEDYAKNIRLIHEAIERGETYQINYTVRTTAQLTGSGQLFYERLRRAQRADYCAWLDCSDFQILSASPELFFIKTGNVVTTRPMKGTVRRGFQPEEDAALERWLSESRKNRAENLMIVDLLRNDLSRIARPGTVNVPALFTIERYPTVLQMTSTVQATLRDEVSLCEIFAAIFPCGSITGAPKLKSMELIRQLEPTPRGPYCGAVGWIKPGGDAQFNVAIRTLVLTPGNGKMVCGLGGGITWDSRSEEEYAEVITKSKFLEFEPKEFELLETMLLKDGQ